MKRFILSTTGAALAAALMFSAPASAGKHDRAKEAIAAASAKVDAANKVGASGETPRLQAEAQRSLATAKEALSAGHKEDAIAAANHAAMLADTAIGQTQKSQNAQADATANAALNAQQDAAAANARADAAQQAAAAASADAAAARAAPPVIVAQAPAVPATTTVTTETVKSSTAARASTPVVKKKVVATRKPATRASVAEKTTTTVTTTPGG
jgi:hypothetical protein